MKIKKGLMLVLVLFMFASPAKIYASGVVVGGSSYPTSKWSSAYSTIGYSHVGSEYTYKNVLGYITREYSDFEMKDQLYIYYENSFSLNKGYNKYSTSALLDYSMNYSYDVTRTVSLVSGWTLVDGSSYYTGYSFPSNTTNISTSSLNVLHTLDNDVEYGIYKLASYKANGYLKEHYTKCYHEGPIWNKVYVCDARQVKGSYFTIGYITLPVRDIDNYTTRTYFKEHVGKHYNVDESVFY